MTSGFPDYTDSAAGPFGQALIAPQKQWTAKELVAAASDEPGHPARHASPTATPTTSSSATWSRSVTGQDYAAFVKDRILDPIGLADTIIPSQTDTGAVGTHGYLNEGWAAFADTPPPAVLAAGGAGRDVTDMSTSVGGTAGNGVSTLADLARWAAADFGNVLLSASSREARTTFGPPGAVLPDATYGLGLQELAGWHFHGGEILGWESERDGQPDDGSGRGRRGELVLRERGGEPQRSPP